LTAQTVEDGAQMDIRAGEEAAPKGAEQTRPERYLELLGIAADAFFEGPDFAAALAFVSRLVLAEGTERVALHRRNADGVFEIASVEHAEPSGNAPALRNARYLALVAETREAVVLGGLTRSAAGDGHGARPGGSMFVPILSREGTWGVLEFVAERGNRFGPADLDFARDLCKLAAAALANADLARRANAAVDELRFLADVGETMVETLDLGTRLDRFLRAVVPRLADWAAVNLIGDDETIATVAIAHRDPALAEVVERLRGPYYGNSETNRGTPVALRTGRSGLLTGVDEQFLRLHIRPDTYDDIRALGGDASFVVPLIAHGRIYGALSAMRTERERPFLERDMRLIEELARRAAVAIANARLFERSSTVADAFQQASLPEKLPRVPGLVFSAYYAAGRREATIGGDWYDAFQLPGGRVVISIGDVAGSGLRAAVLMGCVRQLIRGAAQLQDDPSAILDAVDHAMRIDYPEAIVTAFVGVVEPAPRRLTYASAGHPPPLLRTAAGEITELATIGLPLGLRGQRASGTGTHLCDERSVLLLYTDGLTESTRDILEGERMVRAALSKPGIAYAPNVARALHDAVLTDGAHDDVALLTVSF
jgi:serine phosphatase RsbU (regulator of sigma subunit)